MNEATFTYTSRARADDWDGFEYPINYPDCGVKDIAIQKPAGMYIDVPGFFRVRPTWPFIIDDNNQHFSDKATYIRGKHEMKFGGEMMRHKNTIRNDFRTMGIFTFNGSASDYAMADFMLGDAFRFQQGGGEYKDLTGYRMGFFFQDRWRATSNLTLNFGLRWDPHLAVHPTRSGASSASGRGSSRHAFRTPPEGYLSRAGIRVAPRAVSKRTTRRLRLALASPGAPAVRRR